MCLISNSPFFLSCKESRIESPTCFYGCFSLGLFEMSQSLTVANALRRTLLSNIHGVAITSVKIEGVFHEYSSIPGIRESVLDILLNLKQIVLKHSLMGNKNFVLKKPLFGYLQVRGPGIVRARDLKLPISIQCIDPIQYIATLSEDGILNMKFEIGSFFTKKNSLSNQIESEKDITYFQHGSFVGKNKENSLNSSNFCEKSSFSQFSKNLKILSLDAVFMPVSKVNFVLEFFKQSEQQIFDHRILLEVWTNGSIHPRHAVSQAFKNLIQVFVRLEKAQVIEA